MLQRRTPNNWMEADGHSAHAPWPLLIHSVRHQVKKTTCRPKCTSCVILDFGHFEGLGRWQR